MPDKNEFVSELLSFLERRESRLIEWGFYDAFFDPQEVEQLVEAEAPSELREAWEDYLETGGTAVALLDDMENAGLLYRVTGAADSYRTRFSEGVRLLAKLRQMFHYQDWASGPNLVSDLKTYLAPRQYPTWDQAAAECWEDLSPLCWEGNRELQRDVFFALSSKGDGNLTSYAGFQRRAFQNILRQYNKQGLSGSVVSAGTGSGKTKAFYIPAYLCVATELQPNQPASTKVVAIYPRNVLLADQLREALSEALKIRGILTRHRMRPMTFAALLGSTPKEKWFDDTANDYRWLKKSGWRRSTNGWVIPFVKSPVDPDKELVWLDKDRREGRTCLYRAGGRATTPDVPDGTLIITREQIQKAPPDVLFLSLEMLNKEMGNNYWSHAFGIGRDIPSPKLLLLDEVHTYEGLTGAHAAWVLRRWRFWSKAKDLHVVGLSATLKEARKHLALVAGIHESRVAEFRPLESEIRRVGMEYNLVVKGDPASGASLLATSIQTGMLLARLLTPRHVPRSDPTSNGIEADRFFARKVFGFSDNLDVLNRWFSDMSDAEATKRLAKLRLHPQRRTPQMRRPLPSPVIRQMEEAGQIWELPYRLGHDLNRALSVTRCSSQDPGADTNSDLIVATASLEVGFDDPEVGAVLHHKRPISMASFIQRKGRAGRRRGTRPWTVIVLSDYGGDRWAFQQAEKLFQPEVDAILLPVTNPHVLKIQSVYFLIDWLGRRINAGAPFDTLSGPGVWGEYAQGRAIPVLNALLRQGDLWESFRRSFAYLFGRPYNGSEVTLDDAAIDTLLWEAPRSLLRHAIPTLLRKLEAKWQYANPGKSSTVEDENSRRPLPGYIPSATFADLDVSEAQLLIPSRDEPTHLSISRTLSETSPGRVSKRYATKVGQEGYWLAYSRALVNQQGGQVASVSDLYSDLLPLADVNGVQVYQPLTAMLEPRPEDVRDTSNSHWEWENLITPSGSGLKLHILEGVAWADFFGDCEAYLHRNHSHVELLRYSRTCRYEIRQRGNVVSKGALHLHATDAEGRTVEEAVGFRQQVDGIRVKVKAGPLAQAIPLDEITTNRFRSDYFLHLIRNSEALSDLLNPFLSEWLWQTSLSMLAATASHQKCSLREAQAKVRSVRHDSAKKVLEAIFQVRDLSASGDKEEEARLKKTIRELWLDPRVVGEMERLETCLWDPLGREFNEWVRGRFVATLAQSFRASAVSLLRDVSSDDLTLDVVWAQNGDAEIYLTEPGGGGLGMMESVVGELNRAPDAFQEAFKHHLGYCPRHEATTNLIGVLNHVISGDSSGILAEAFERVRESRGFQALAEARDELKNALSDSGFNSTRSLIIGVVTRLLQPGSTPVTDALILRLNQAWHRESKQIGLTIDPRVFAYVCVRYKPLNRRLKSMFADISGGVPPTDTQLYTIIQRFLFPPCEDSCHECLNQPNWFNNFGIPSKALALARCDLGVPEVTVRGTDWLSEVRRHLRTDLRVRVTFDSEQSTAAVVAIHGLLGEEIRLDFLMHPVSVLRVEKKGSLWQVTLGIREVWRE